MNRLKKEAMLLLVKNQTIPAPQKLGVVNDIIMANSPSQIQNIIKKLRS